MGSINLDDLLEFHVDDNLTEEQLDNLHSSLVALDEDDEKKLGKEQLLHLFSLAKHAMESKQVQLGVAVEELDKLAEAAGENEELKQQNQELRKTINKYKNKSTDGRGVDLRAEVEELQAARNQLKKDLKSKHKQLDDEKRENDKLSTRLEELESERRELKRQVDQLTETIEEMRRGYDSRSDPEEAGEHQYAELIRQKNQYINVLLDDVESLEKERSEAKSQLLLLRDQLADATQQITTVTSEFEEYRKQFRPTGEDGRGEAARTVQRLEAQVAELQAVKARRDRQFDQLSNIVEQRTEEFKRLINDRDEQIESLQEELRRSNSRLTSSEVDSDKRRMSELEELCERQRQQLSALQADLRRATADMEATARLLEQSQTGRASPGDDRQSSSLLALRADLARSEAQVRQLTQQLENTEKQGAAYNEQVTALTRRLREVMEGEFGLSEAVSEIKECQRQLHVRDQQVAEQNRYINLVQRHLTELVDENTALRNRLNMEPHEAAELVANHAGKEKLVHVLEREVEKLEEERIALKLENRKLSRQLRAGEPAGLSPEEIRDICRQRKEFWDYVKRLGPAAPRPDWQQTSAADMCERLAATESQLAEARQQLVESERTAASCHRENQQLRHGMREILESIKEQDASSSVKLVAPSLEALLQAMDTRSLVGEYHPSLVPYSRLQQLEGKNDELRDQLRAARAQARGAVSAAAPADVDPQLAAEMARVVLPRHVTASSSQVIGQLTCQLLTALKALDDYGRDTQEMRAELETMRRKFSVLRHQMGLLYRQRADDADQWRGERCRLQRLQEESEHENQVLQAQLQQLQAAEAVSQLPADAQRTRVVEVHRQMALRAAELVRAERRLRLESAERAELADRLRRAEAESQRAQLAATERLAALRADKAGLEFQLSALQREFEKSAPLHMVTEVNSKVDELTSKYSTLLSRQEKLLGEERTCRVLEAEISLLRDQLDAARALSEGELSPQTAVDETACRAQLAEMTQRELRQRQRADHATRLLQLLKDQLAEAERHGSELEARMAELAEGSAAGRLALARLADQLVEPVAEPAQPAETALQQRLVELTGERDRLKGTLELASDQLQFLRSQRDSAEQGTARLRQELAELQDKDDLRAVIAVLHQRLLTADQSAAELRGQLSGSRAALTAAEARLYRAETEAADVRRQMARLRAAHAHKIRTVRCVVQELRGCLSLPQRDLQERLCETLTDLVSRRRTLQEEIRAAQTARDEAAAERQGVRAQRALLEEALGQLQTGAVDVRHWLERCQGAELEVTSLRLRTERLTAECNHVRSQLNEEERRATDAESTICRLKNQLQLRLNDEQLEWPVPSAGSERSPPASVGSASSQPIQSAAGGASRPASAVEPASPSEAHALKEALRQHVSALRGLLTPLEGQPDVQALRRRLSAALDGPSPAVQLLLTSTDIIRLSDVRAVVTSPSDAGPQSARTLPGELAEPAPPEPPELPEPSSAGPLPEPALDDYSLRRRLRLAEAAAAGLEQRLAQKEQSLAEYRRLLGQARQQMAEQAERHQQELARASDQLRQQMALVASLQAESSSRESAAGGDGGGPLSSSQLSRLHESGELLAEQERAIGALMERLRQSRDQEARYKDRVDQLEGERRNTAELLQRTAAALNEECSQLRAQLAEERRRAAAAGQAQSSARLGLLHRLAEIMRNKERQHHALARVLRDLKSEILQTVEEAAQLEQENAKQQLSGDLATVLSRGDADSLHGQLSAAQAELDTIKGELNERTLQCHRLQAELHESERRRVDDTQRLHRQLEAARQKLRAAQPAQTARAKPPSDPHKIQEELAKWEERKRWQRTVDRLRGRLKEKEAECERQQAIDAGLRDTIHRLEREKAAHEAKIRTLSVLVSEERYQAMERENQQLREQLSQRRGSDSVERSSQLDQLRQQVHTLTSRLAAQRAAAKRGKSAASNVARYEAELAQLRTRTQELEEQNCQLKAEISELRRAGEAQEGASGDRSAGSGDADGWPPPAAAPAAAAADQGTVSILRRLVERLRADNLRLRRELLRHTVTATTEEQVDILKSELNRAVAERDNMAAQLQRMRAMELNRH